VEGRLAVLAGRRISGPARRIQLRDRLDMPERDVTRQLRALCITLAVALGSLLMACDPRPASVTIRNDLPSTVAVEINGGYRSTTIGPGASKAFVFDVGYRARSIVVTPVDHPERTVSYHLDRGLFDQALVLRLSDVSEER
jgi:hypothetical protein